MAMAMESKFDFHNRLKEGEVFSTFAEFDELFKKYQAQTKYVYVAKNGVTVASHNKTIKREEFKMPEEWKYKAVQYQCKLFGEHKSKGTGVRPNQW